jgi:hypothetical protein
MNLVEAAVCGMDDGPEILSLNPTSLGDVLGDAARER